jgi:hypothetical protein
MQYGKRDTLIIVGYLSTGQARNRPSKLFCEDKRFDTQMINSEKLFTKSRKPEFSTGAQSQFCCRYAGI